MIIDAEFKEIDHSMNADFGVVYMGRNGNKREVDYSLIANALKGNASGSAVAMTDVSPLAHVLGVKARVINRYDETAYPLTSGYIRYDTGGVVEHTSYICTKDYVPCGDLQGKTITINKHNSGGTYVGLAWYDENKSYISGVQGAGGYVALSVPSNAVYLRFTEDAGASEIQLEIGAMATPYKPYADISTANVLQYGGNILDIEGRKVVNFGASANTTQRTFTGNGIIKGFAYSNYYISANVSTFEKHKNGFSFTNVENQSSYGIGFDLKALPNTVYSIYCDELTSGNVFLSEYDKDGNFLRYATSTKVDGVWRKFTTGENTAWIVVSFQSSLGTTSGVFNNVYIGVDTFAGFEPYREPTTYPISADGTVEGVTSIYPTTTLTSDTEGIVLDVEYNRDINKAFAELTNAIISLGGNV